MQCLEYHEISKILSKNWKIHERNFKMISTLCAKTCKGQDQVICLHVNWMPKLRPSAMTRLCFFLTTPQFSVDKQIMESPAGNCRVPRSTSRHFFMPKSNSTTLPTSVPTARHPSNNSRSQRAQIDTPPTKQQLVILWGTSITRMIRVPWTANRQTIPSWRSLCRPTARTQAFTSGIFTSSTQVMFSVPAFLNFTNKLMEIHY